MEDNFKLEIISPEKIILSENVKLVTVPSYEGNMSILKNHISIITFLRPGIINVDKDGENFSEFFVQDGTVEFFNNNLVILSSSAIIVKNISKEFLETLRKESEDKLAKTDINDRDRYILNHKIDTIKGINI